MKLTNVLKPIINKRISKSYLEKVDRDIKTIAGVDIRIPGTKGYLPILIFHIRDVYEFLSAMSVFVFFAALFIIIGILENKIANGIIMAIGIIALTYSRYTMNLKKFKENFKYDLTDTIESMLQGLKVGLPIETVIEYIIDNKDNIVTPFLKEISTRINAGESLSTALKNVTPKTLSPEFERISKILSMRSQSTADIVTSIEKLQENIELEIDTKIISMAENSQTKYFFHILIGYIFPFIVMILYPLVTMILKFMTTFGS